MSNSPRQLNLRWADTFVNSLSRYGIRNVCITPGSRSTPLTLAFTRHPDFTAYSHIDERSGAFFALGLSKSSGLPTVLVCTSGTAGANFYPAIIEAAASETPLIVCTADRPPELHGTGANQTIDQRHLYGRHVRWFHNVGLPSDVDAEFEKLRDATITAVEAAMSSQQGPVHLNFPFRKPLEPESLRDLPVLESVEESAEIPRDNPRPLSDDDISYIAEAIDRSQHGLILAGPLSVNRSARESILKIAELLSYPILADGLSGFRFGYETSQLLIHHASDILRSKDLPKAFFPDLILRFGRMPTSNTLNTFLSNHKKAEQILFNQTGRIDDATHSVNRIIPCNIGELYKNISAGFSSDISKTQATLLKYYFSAEKQIKHLVEENSWPDDAPSEPGIFPALIPLIPAGSQLMLSNSLPVRDLDWFAPSSEKDINVYFNRGVSGIDGIISTAFGIAAQDGKPTVLVTGDLAFHHDMNGLLAWKRYQIPLTIVLINNDGGGIFDMLPISNLDEAKYREYFQTAHGLNFRKFVEGFGGNFHSVQSRQDFRQKISQTLNSDSLDVIEVKTESKASMSHRREIWDAIADEISVL
ncbi:MAG: 2-succinyl-5-enolpyruvyl-6-hydroxy-3-cyclohexene-1-carboxylic-acid synthase [Candidatus Marinimicrobia bacterium]|nr:2-succinyl-5-enolpyruvyl-6-hydroxy-3-cyclohexene-1-carboxylic-acid synthase [Candidatus Neomarinimicrobiota bacterium]MCF7828229.1 2-succinyl-5-enolpyruvyl-6-hydroxy-3-cyclohexene-1-carboxylic-acid synthase [Candidatus Neomarinimicrobiota bacterium]MCF7879596.1 2-succinyl-5-enolpyruvyl-6-hydroxy-3-cyclohexene-1-carboxylic-acid synthase [Candidatus Neomarinimicrobiota bacterium]